jgi:hypothetical protein
MDNASTQHLPLFARNFLASAEILANTIHPNFQQKDIDEVDIFFQEVMGSEALNSPALQDVANEFTLAELFKNPRISATVFESLQNHEKPLSEIRLVNTIMNDDDVVLKQRLASVLLVLIHKIKAKENENFSKDPPTPYAEITASIDGMFSLLIQLYTILSSYDTGVAHMDTVASTLKGARKGGNAKADRTEPLKKLVISEWTNKYQQLSNVDAARRIHRTLSSKDLNDTENKPLLVDPIQAFHRWIAKHKKEITES